MPQPKSAPATIFLTELFNPEAPEERHLGFGQLFVESSFMMAIALFFPYIMGFAQGGMIALFLVSASMMRRIKQILEENNQEIGASRKSGLEASRRSVLQIFGIFLGIFLTTILFNWLIHFLSAGKANAVFFDFILKAENINTGVPLAERFSSFSGTLINNYTVLLTTLFLVFLYRAYGMILIIAWNACIWAVLLFHLFHQAWLNTKISTFMFVTRALAGVLPHLFVEAFAYILAALAALFFSRSFAQYGLGEPGFKAVAKISFGLLIFACVQVFLAGILEATLPGMLLQF